MKLFVFSDNLQDGYTVHVCAISRDEAIKAVRDDIYRMDLFYADRITKGISGYEFHKECNLRNLETLERCIKGEETFPGSGPCDIREFDPGVVV